MAIRCVWEHNGNDTLLYAADYPGAFTRGASFEEAAAIMPQEILRYCRWLGTAAPEDQACMVAQEKKSELMIRDADSDVLFDHERLPLSHEEYLFLKKIALKSAQDFQTLFDSIPNHDLSCLTPRKTFYGRTPCTAQEMYHHTCSVNPYYFGEVEVAADAEGGILACRERGFAHLEEKPDFLLNRVYDGSYGEEWSLRKVFRRFIWHDRIHARAMYRMACRTFPNHKPADPFRFHP